MTKLKRFRHIDIEKAHRMYYDGIHKKYRVETINWTYATEKGKQNFKKVHHNVYKLSLLQLVDFIRNTGCVAEDVIDIREWKDEE